MANQTLTWKLRLGRGEADFGRLVPFAGNTYQATISGGASGAVYTVYVMDDGGTSCLAKSATDAESGACSIALNGAALHDAFLRAAHEIRTFHAYVKDSSGGVVAEGEFPVQWQPLWTDVATGEVYTMQGPQGAKGDAVGVSKVEKTGEDADGGYVYRITYTDGTTAHFTAPRGAKGEAGEVDYGTVVRTVEQSLDEAARKTARDNIGAASAADVAKKVDAVEGKVLSSNDFTDELMAKLASDVGKIYVDGVYCPATGSEGRVDLSVAGRFAPLEDGKIPTSYLPGSLSDVVEYVSLGNFPSTGVSNRIYVAQDTGKIYRWGGTAYVEISSSLALGTTANTAYPGLDGAANADRIKAHVADKGNPHGVTAEQIGAASAAELSSHESNGDIHVTQAEKDEWGSKQEMLKWDVAPKASSKNAISSGAVKTALDAKADAASLESHVGDAVAHVAASERAAWNAKQDAIASGIAEFAGYCDDGELGRVYAKSDPKTSGSEERLYNIDGVAIPDCSFLYGDPYSTGTSDYYLSVYGGTPNVCNFIPQTVIVVDIGLAKYPLHTVELYNGSAPLLDRTVNWLDEGAGLILPDATSGIARDFVVAVKALSAAPTISFPSHVEYYSDDDDVFSAEADAINVWYLSEIASGKFMISHKVLSQKTQS